MLMTEMTHILRSLEMRYHSLWMLTNGRFRNLFPKAIGKFTTHLYGLQKYSRKEVTKITNLELFIITFSANYLNKVLITKTIEILKHPMDPGEFILWIGYYFHMGLWVRIPNRRNLCLTAEPNMSEGVTFKLNKYLSRTRFEGIILSLCYTNI